MHNLFIHNYIYIRNGEAYVGGEKIFSADASSTADFFKQLYNSKQLQYSKFFKMDLLSKLGFLASHLLLEDCDNEDFQPEETALLIFNRSSSLQTDIKYQASIADVPSPAVFVYTLPNILIGEICIAHQFRGETLFMVQEKPDVNFWVNYAQIIFQNTNTQQLILGWIELDKNENYHAMLTLVTPEESETILSTENLQLLL